MKPRSNTRPISGTRSVLRAISVLKTLGGSGSAYGITELGTATGLSKATVFRLLGALESEGMVAREVSTGLYRLGPELIALGASALSTSDLRIVARDELVRIAEESGEAATLETLSEGEILVVDEVQGRFLFGATPEIGRSWPSHATSTGKILLALSADAQTPSRFPKFAPRTISSRAELDRELTRVRHQGYAVAVDELEPGLVAIAAPIINHLGLVVAALSINGPGTRLGPKRRRALIPKLLRAANRVSRRLGASSAMIAPHDRRSGVAS
jgi:IclR family transcriptional regulator, acetate operon repressor